MIRDLPLGFDNSAGFTGKGRLNLKYDYPVEVTVERVGGEYEWRVTVPWEKEKDKIGIDYRFTLSSPKSKV